jgi:hypothetical protein
VPFLSRLLGTLSAATVLSLAVWLGRYSRWSDSAFRAAAEETARNELAERRRIAAEEQRQEAQRPKPPVHDRWRPEIATKPPFPKVELKETVFDFGTFHVGEEKRHVFHIKNVGEAPLVLMSGPPSCMTTVEPFHRELQIGESVDYEIKWTAHERAVNFAIVRGLFTNDPRWPQLMMKVYGKVVEPEKPIDWRAFDILPE